MRVACLYSEVLFKPSCTKAPCIQTAFSVIMYSSLGFYCPGLFHTDENQHQLHVSPIHTHEQILHPFPYISPVGIPFAKAHAQARGSCAATHPLGRAPPREQPAPGGRRGAVQNHQLYVLVYPKIRGPVGGSSRNADRGILGIFLGQLVFGNPHLSHGVCYGQAPYIYLYGSESKTLAL